jgi:8-oxo-dGTP diphosphatase
MGKIKRAVSAGGIIFKKDKEEIWVALISPREGVWALPKGLVEKEKREETAIREVFEETGLKGKVLDELGYIDYWFFDKREMAKIHKYVYFYLLEYEEGTTENHDWEVLEAKWFPLKEAKKVLTYPSEREILEKAEAWLLEHGYT